MLQQYAGAMTVSDLQHYPRYEYIRRLMVSLAPVSVIRSNAHRTQGVRASRTPDTCVIIEEETASLASKLATPVRVCVCMCMCMCMCVCVCVCVWGGGGGGGGGGAHKHAYTKIHTSCNYRMIYDKSLTECLLEESTMADKLRLREAFGSIPR